MQMTSRSRSPNAIAWGRESTRRFTSVRLKTGPGNSSRPCLVFDVRRPALQFHKPVRRFRENCELGQIPAHHRYFIAAMKSRTCMTVFINLVWKVLALRDRESLPPKEIRLAREQADAVHLMPLRLGQQRFHQTPPTAFAL